MEAEEAVGRSAQGVPPSTESCKSALLALVPEAIQDVVEASDKETTEGRPQEPVPSTTPSRQSLSLGGRRLQRTECALREGNRPKSSHDASTSEGTNMDADPAQMAKKLRDQT